MSFRSYIEGAFKVISVTGDEYRCYCSFHRDTEGKFYVNALTGAYICFSAKCGVKGTLANGIDPPSAEIEDVRKKIERLREPQTKRKPHPELWLRQFTMPTTYWTEDRNLPQGVVEAFDLGFDPFTNRATIPLRDVHGNVLGVTYRRIDGGLPKYLHPHGFPVGRHLFGAWLLKGSRTVAVMEGQMDAIRGWTARVPSVSTMGARITPDQIRVLQRSGVQKVVFMYDNDNAGVKGCLSAYDALKGSGIQMEVGWYRSYWLTRSSEGDLIPVKDPDQLSQQRIKKMFHTSVNPHEWAEIVTLQRKQKMAG